MRALLDDARYWVEHGTYPLAEAAVRVHHRMVAIHPWPNGNGRHARLMADLVLAAHEAPALSWGANLDLARLGATRADYIAALKEADRGDIGPLVKFAGS